MESTAHPRGAERHNRMAVVSFVCAIVAVAGLVLGGLAVLAVFVVGAGHVAINQINLKGGQGRQLARAALAVGCSIEIFGLFSTVLAVSVVPLS